MKNIFVFFYNFMEYILCGKIGHIENIEGMVKYIGLTEEKHTEEYIEETIYSMNRYRIVISKGTVEKETKDKDERRTISIIYPADRSKNRKSLNRKRIVSEVEGSNIEEILEGIGCKGKRKREYRKITYKYKEGEVIIVEKGSDKIVIGKSEGTDGESILEEIKNKLRIWVDLEIPPESVYEYMI